MTVKYSFSVSVCLCNILKAITSPTRWLLDKE